MEGTIKYFNSNRGFGFIHVPGEPDRFFHISELKDPEPPNIGDSVTFEVAAGKDGRPIAVQVQIAVRKPAGPRTPYYAKPTYRTVPAETPASQTLTGAGLLGAIGLLIGGPFGGIIGAGIGATLAEKKKQEEITSPCIKCGGVGSTTATVDGWTGFQCKTCHHFWKVRSGK